MHVCLAPERDKLCPPPLASATGPHPHHRALSSCLLAPHCRVPVVCHQVAERREQHTQTLQARSRDLKEAVQEAEQAEAVVQDELGRSLRAAAMAAAKRQANDADVRSSSIDGDRSAADSDPGTGEQLSEDDEDFGDARPI